MRLYSGTTKSFIEDSTYNRIATKLTDAFFLEFRYQPPVGEVNSWNNSLRAVSQVFQAANLLAHGVLLELQLPLTSKRLDCLVTGYDSKKADRKAEGYTGFLRFACKMATGGGKTTVMGMLASWSIFNKVNNDNSSDVRETGRSRNVLLFFSDLLLVILARST